jgi:hypothetical protein
MQMLHGAFIDRAAERLDPLLIAQYGRTMSAWAETRWLYWLDELTTLPADGARVWLIHPDELGAVSIGSAALAWIGRRPADSLGGFTDAQIDTSPWTQHSDSRTIVRAVRELSRHAQVVLFHSFPRRLDRFIDDNALERCSSLRDEPHRL